MKSLKESILSDIEDTLNQGDEDIKKYDAFGYMFKFSRGISSTKAASVFSARSLQKLTKGMSYINDNINPNNVIFDSKNKCNMFLNWLEHLTFEELNIDIYNTSDFSSLEFQKALTAALRDLCKKNDIFNSFNKIDIYVLKARDYDKDSLFEIFISNRYSFSASSMMKFVYKKR